MKLVNYEFKAHLRNEGHVRALLKKLRARFAGTDRQVDTYFRVPIGRLKVREGNIENALIFYERTNQPRARQSKLILMPLSRRNALRPILAAVFGVLVVVRKRREIYFVGNVKIHLDRVPGLGKFIEVEALSRSGNFKKIRKQAQKFQKLLGVRASDIVPQSYSDLVLAKRERSAVV